MKNKDNGDNLPQLRGVYLLRCKKCTQGLYVFPDKDGKPLAKKPKGLRVSDYKCPDCRGAMGEAVVRACYTCKRERVVLTRSHDCACPDCGDTQGYATTRFISSKATGERTITL